jgi:hypothetical protein
MEARTMYLFVEGGDEHNPNVKPQVREKKFIELLEFVHPEDARAIIGAKNRRLAVSQDVVRMAFPGLLPDDSTIIERIAEAPAQVMAAMTGKKPLTEEQREKIRARKRAARARDKAKREADARARAICAQEG